MRGVVLSISAVLLLSGCLARPMAEHRWEAWGFAVGYPGAVVEQATPGGFTVAGAGKDKDLTVTVRNLTDDTPDDQVMSDAVQAIAAGKPVRLTYWALGPAGAQHMGREAVIDDGAGLKRRVHVLVANRRLYAVSVRSMGGNSPKAQKFLDSFRIIEPAVTPAS